MTTTTKRAASEAAGALARARKSRKLRCAVCAGSFRAVDAKAMYCGNACKVKAYQQRRKERDDA